METANTRIESTEEAGAVSMSPSTSLLGMDVVEPVARAICWACEENPDHRGDCRGNKHRWEDYVPVARAAIEAMPNAGGKRHE